MTTNGKQRLYIGTYTHLRPGQPDRAESIYIYDFDPAHGKLNFRDVVCDVVNPSFLTLSKDRQRLFAVNEVAEYSAAGGGGLGAFTIDRESGQVAFINTQPTHGALPCYVILDPTEKWALVTNYGSGSTAVFPVADDGRLGESVALLQSHGHGLDPERQASAHAHSVRFDLSQRYVFVADLGVDQIQIFRFDASSGQLTPHDIPFIAAPPGAGPRHLEFHPNERYLYVANELNATVSVYDCDLDHGSVRPLQTISTLPDDFAGIKWVADIHITRSGQFLYVSNRGHDSIALFAVDPQTGLLTMIETVSSGGGKPRNFALDLTERYLLVANQESHNLVVFQRDQHTGRLTPTAESVSIPSPVCVKIVEGD